MNTDQFWDLIESARREADDPSDSDQVASEASTLLATRPRDEIIAAEAMRATGDELPEDGFTMRHPEQDPEWDLDFDDQAEMARRLPRLSALYTD